MIDLQEQNKQPLTDTSPPSAFLDASEVDKIFHNLPSASAPPSPTISLSSSHPSSDNQTTTTNDSQGSSEQYEADPFFANQATPGPVYAASPQPSSQGILSLSPLRPL